MRLFGCLAGLTICSLALAQSVSTRWALPIAGTGNEMIVARQGGGVFLFNDRNTPTKVTAYSSTGTVAWVLQGFGTGTRFAYAPDGSLLVADMIGDISASSVRVRRFDSNGALAGTLEEPTGRPYGTVRLISFAAGPGGVVVTLLNEYFSEASHLIRLNSDLSLAYHKMIPTAFGLSAWIDPSGDVLSSSAYNGSGTAWRHSPTGSLKWQIPMDGLYNMAPLPNELVLTGHSSYDHQGGNASGTGRINANGTLTTIGFQQGYRVAVFGSLVYTFLNTSSQPRAQLTRRTLAGNFLWTRDFGYNGQAEAFGGDPWLNGYVMVRTAGTSGVRLHKINSAGKTLWYRTGGLDGAVSPYNHDIYQFDKASNRIRLYCFQQAPVGKPDSYVVANTTTLDVNVGANDQYGVDAAYSLVSPPTVGTATVEANGRLTYQPQSGFTGQVTLTYQAAKAGLTPTGPITVTLNVTN